MTIKRCHFCGSHETAVYECEDTSAGCSTFWVECEDCSARGSISEYKDGAVQYWNGARIAPEIALGQSTQVRELK